MQEIRLYAEAYQQLASISAVLGGLAFAAAAIVLNAGAGTDDPNALSRAAKITAATAVSSSVCLVIAALAWSLMSADLIRIAANSDGPAAGQVANLNWIPSFLLLGGSMLFFVSVGVSGWIGSRRLGFVTSAVALAGGTGLLFLFYWTWS